ncbi:GIY-YIG nuclease family protein [uncultured Draconibacterium sp.]|uniref:GIY-YIG nuclease family protein n=1 Tax=uncultured Draconibacterium sp. TaxID=1573823 RepID=UPI0025E0C4FE|nr:GIY-YIG nuclease family protein [uncultured Draconibacterium sp.]
MKGYFKKIDRSIMEWGFVIPKEFVNDFLNGQILAVGDSRDIELLWNRKKYSAKIRHKKGKNPQYLVQWSSNNELLSKLRTTFVQSYIVLKSQKELFDKNSSKEGKHFRTKLAGGQQEVIVFTPIGVNIVKVDEFIVIENEWNELFKRLITENVFGWIFEKNDKEYLIQRSTDWMDVRHFPSHQNAVNVIYYLANTEKKLLYIGKAKNLGTRVKPGRKHQNMPGDWDLFKYDIIRIEFANILERIEDHTIRTVASILNNQKGYSSLNLSEYTLVNDKWKKL